MMCIVPYTTRAPARGQYHLDKENHCEIYSKKQSTRRKKQSGTSSNPAYTDVFFESFLLRFLLSKWYCPQGDAPTIFRKSLSSRIVYSRGSPCGYPSPKITCSF